MRDGAALEFREHHPVGGAPRHVSLVGKRHEHVPVPRAFPAPFQPGDVRRRVTKVNVFVDDAVHHQHLPLHVPAPSNHRRVRVPRRVPRGGAHVTLGVVRVVPLPRGHRRARDGAREDVRQPRQRRSRQESAVAPPEDAHPRRVDDAGAHQVVHPARLVLHLHRAEVAADGALEPLTPPRATPVVELQHDEAPGAVGLRADVRREVPRVLNRLRVGTPVHAHDARIGRRAVHALVRDVRDTVERRRAVGGGHLEGRRRR
mmetsp:Transcript_4835/g.22121  ORF Transcript_4835/g.22121 Transcript_4835/m.22121 type:complete len:259 (-) Transcript_4835:1942-2718(-)